MSNSKTRIEWIDLAKGICISLVVLHHIESYYHTPSYFSQSLSPIRMPLYFLLSGLFFKQYDSFLSFIKRKINNLIIPYLFFFMTLGIIGPCLFYEWSGYKIDGYWGYPITKGFCFVFTETLHGNTAIWFLLSLFEVNCIFYFIKVFTNKCEKQFIVSTIVIILCGVIGVLSKRIGGFPCFFDTSLSALPFFYVGYLLNHKTSLLAFRPSLSKVKFILLSYFVVILITALFLHDKVNCSLFSNSFGNFKSIMLVYPMGLSGTLAIFAISILIKKAPLISYIGRYSIMLLCTHAHVYCLLDFFFLRRLGEVTNLEGTYYIVVISFVITLLSYILIIPVFLKTIPYFTAQKGVIKI